MIIYIGADHRGFELKGHLITALKNQGYEIADLGAETLDNNDDFPDYAAAVAEKVSRDYENARGIVICGSGVGVDIVANKFPRIRSALVSSSDQAYDSRNDDNTNILSLAANYLDPDQAAKIALTWLNTPYADEPRFNRRLQKIYDIERSNIKDL